MKKYIIRILVGILVVLVLNFIVGIFLKEIVPSFISESTEKCKNDKALMNKIGGYVSFKSTFNVEKYAKNGDTTSYEIQIIGLKKGILLNGQAIKNNEKWIVVNEKKQLFEY